MSQSSRSPESVITFGRNGRSQSPEHATAADQLGFHPHARGLKSSGDPEGWYAGGNVQRHLRNRQELLSAPRQHRPALQVHMTAVRHHSM
jgi:hypothetical protein